MNAIIDAIHDLHRDRRKRQKPRRYLGASEIGHQCERALWYSFRRALDVIFEPRILRLFETGDREEERMVAELKAIGCEVLDRNPRTRRQWAIEAFGGHFRGHMDGLIRRVPGEDPERWFLLELKTSNAKRFREVVKHGCAAKRPRHYAQMQVYIGFARANWESYGLPGEPPESALYVVHNKDSDALHTEIVLFDEWEFAQIGAKATRILEAAEPPERVRDSPEYYLCRFCDFAPICHDANAPEIDCRTCTHSTPDTEAGGWRCDRFARPALEVCGDHLFIAPLLEERHGAVVDTDGVTFITFADGTRHGDGGLSSEEMAAKENTSWPRIG